MWYIVLRGLEKERVHVYERERESARAMSSVCHLGSCQDVLDLAKAIANTELFDVHEYEVL